MANYHPKTDHLKKTQWAKGQSGNPAGKPKGEHTSTRLRKFLELTQTTRNPITGSIEEMTVLDQMCLAMIMKARAGDTKAYSLILDIVEGKPGRAKASTRKDPIGKPLLSNARAAMQDQDPTYAQPAAEIAESQLSKKSIRPKSEIVIDRSGDRPHPLSW